MAKQIKVDLAENSYKIFLGEVSLQQLVEVVNKSNPTKCLVVIDSNVFKYHSFLIKKTLALLDCKVYYLPFIANEKNKNLKQVQKLYLFLSENYFDRNSAIVAVGGGITGDVVSFAASTFMRGIAFYQVPTTLLSMVDSSVGGKTGVNYNHKKNLVGTFYQPKAVFVNPVFLSSLPKREMILGAGELFKYAFLADESTYNLIKKNLEKIFYNKDFDHPKTISASLKIKANIVSQDEKETSGLRKLLNLGHTFAHAFEVESNYSVKHGEAVIAGVFCAINLSVLVGYLSKQQQEKFINDFSFIKLNNKIKKMSSENVFKIMQSDKKNLKGNIRLVLIEDIGKIIVDAVVKKSLILKSIEQTKKLKF